MCYQVSHGTSHWTLYEISHGVIPLDFPWNGPRDFPSDVPLDIPWKIPRDVPSHGIPHGGYPPYFPGDTKFRNSDYDRALGVRSCEIPITNADARKLVSWNSDSDSEWLQKVRSLGICCRRESRQKNSHYLFPRLTFRPGNCFGSL